MCSFAKQGLCRNWNTRDLKRDVASKKLTGRFQVVVGDKVSDSARQKMEHGRRTLQFAGNRPPPSFIT